MSSHPVVRLSSEEYLVTERQSEYKSEYFNGEMFAMTGASQAHNLIVMNIGASLHSQLQKSPCEVYPSDMRVKVSSVGLYTYPDVTVVCEGSSFDDEQRDTLLNPTIIVEVLSQSTEAYDRGRKFEHYRKLESLKEYLLIAQDKPHVEHYTRHAENRWLLSEVGDLVDTVHLSSIDCTLALTDVYGKVDFRGGP